MLSYFDANYDEEWCFLYKILNILMFNEFYKSRVETITRKPETSCLHTESSYIPREYLAITFDDTVNSQVPDCVYSRPGAVAMVGGVHVISQEAWSIYH